MYGSNIPEPDWYVLRDLVLAALHGAVLPSVPEHLVNHPVVQSIKAGRASAAARDLVPAHPEQAYQVLAKS